MNNTVTTCNVELVQFKKAVFGRNKLTIDESITLDEWRDLGQGLKQIEGSVQFWLADWIKYGDDNGFTSGRITSAVYDQLEDITGYSRQTLKNVNSIAGKVPTSVRREELSFSHHAEVSDLGTEEQKTFLDKAVNEKLSVRELRDEVRRSKGEKRQNMLTLQKINDQLDWEKELKNLAKQINTTYTKEQRNFLIKQIKL